MVSELYNLLYIYELSFSPYSHQLVENTIAGGEILCLTSSFEKMCQQYHQNLSAVNACTLAGFLMPPYNTAPPLPLGLDFIIIYCDSPNINTA